MLNEQVPMNEIYGEQEYAGESFEKVARRVYRKRLEPMLYSAKQSSDPNLAALAEVVEFLLDSYEKGRS